MGRGVNLGEHTAEETIGERIDGASATEDADDHDDNDDVLTSPRFPELQPVVTKKQKKTKASRWKKKKVRKKNAPQVPIRKECHAVAPLFGFSLFQPRGEVESAVTDSSCVQR